MNIKRLTQEGLIDEIGTFHQILNRTLSRFSDETLNTVPFEKSWTAGQVAEHIIKSQLYIIAQLSEGPVLTAGRLYDQEVNTIQEIFRDKKSKAKTDESIAPGPPPHDLKTLLKALQKQKGQQIEIIKTKKLEEFSAILEFPGIWHLSRYEWIHMMIEHGQRHRRQIDSIYKKLYLPNRTKKHPVTMKSRQQVLFIHGGGDGGYEADKKLVTSLQKVLGKEYDIDYSEIHFDESAPDFGWTQQIEKRIADSKSDVIIVGHSFGASMILKCLSENSGHKKMKGIFLIAPPFWSGNEEWKQGIKLQKDFADKLPDQTPIFFYHCKDDEEVPFSQLDDYKKHLHRATYREIESGGHQLNNDLSIVAKDIELL